MKRCIFLIVYICMLAAVTGDDQKDVEDLEDLKGLALDVREGLAQVKKENAKLRKEVSDLKLLHRENHTKKRQTHQSYKVAFTALLTPGSLSHMRPHTPLVFDRPITNVGHAYNWFTGRFTAPVSGTYVFIAGVQCLYRQTSTFEFVRDGTSMMPVHCDSRGMGGTESSSRTLSLHLTTGQSVWIQSTGNYHGEDSIHGHNFSDFTGFLVFED